MKASIPIMISALFTLPASAAELTLDQCPAAVQETIRKNQRGGRIDEIESHQVEGKTLYVAEVDLPDRKDLKMHIAADGTLIKLREDLALADLPSTVRAVVNQHLGGGRVDDVEKEVAGETTTYQVEIDHSGTTPDLRLWISAGGELLQKKEDR